MSADEKRISAEVSKPTPPVSSGGNNLPELHLRTSTLRYFTSSTPHRPFTTVSRSESACLSCNTPLQVIVFRRLRVRRTSTTSKTPTLIDVGRENEFRRSFKTNSSSFIRGNNLPELTCERRPSIFHIPDPARPLTTVSRSERLLSCNTPLQHHCCSFCASAERQRHPKHQL